MMYMSRKMDDTRTVRQIAEETIEVLQNHRWIQDQASDGDGGICAAGAVMCTLDSSFSQYVVPPSRQLLASNSMVHLNNRFKEVNGMFMQTYNDYVAKSKEDVIEAFRRVIKAEVDDDG